MEYQAFFPTVVLFDKIPEVAEKLLILCDKYTENSNTNLLNQANFPSTLYDNSSYDVNKEPLVIETLDYIHEKYIRKLVEDRGIFYTREKFGNAFGFFSDMKKGAQLRKHSHQDCKFSGILYLDAGSDVPDLIFHDPRPSPKFETMDFKTPSVIPVKPETGLLVIWDHWLEHEVPEKTNNQPRKAFSFNI